MISTIGMKGQGRKRLIDKLTNNLTSK